MICSDCGKSYKKISIHWSQTNCSHYEMMSDEIELIEGMLMGDGTIPCIKNTDRKNTFFAAEMVSPRFLEWLDKRINISTGVRLKHTKEEQANRKNSTPSNYNATYILQTLSTPQLNKIRNRWYSDEGKEYPENLSLTPMMLKLWYCGDGGLNWDGRREAYANIKCSNESDNEEGLLDMFKDIGFNPSFRQDRICFNSNTRDFLDWIGKPLPGFEYKWENIDRDSYNCLRELSYK